MVLDPGSAGWSFQNIEPEITAKQLAGPECGRPDDCRLIEAADGTRYWFRSRGCPVEALPTPPWTELDELAAEAWSSACRTVVADPSAYAEEIDNYLCSLYTSVSVPEPDDEPLYDKLVRLYNKIKDNPEYRRDPWPPPYPPAALRALWAYTSKFLGNIND